MLATIACVIGLAAGCSGRDGPRRIATERETSCSAGSYRQLGSARLAYAAVVRARAVVLRRPGGANLGHFSRLNVNGVPVVFGVLGERLDRSCAPSWYRVQVPIRPNGTTGWVRADEVDLTTVTTRIVVDLSARRLRLFRAGRPALTAPVAVGAPATPTPAGRYYVNQRMLPNDPGGPYGPGAVGISAFSNVLTGWTQGGPVAIHGTNEPWSIGRDVSNGCIRLRNPVLRRVFAQALPGTPVLIRR